MADLVACPVCTLYLHKGMSLAEHLDTHPKEQVIRALVAFTSISKPEATDPAPISETETSSTVITNQAILTTKISPVIPVPVAAVEATVTTVQPLPTIAATATVSKSICSPPLAATKLSTNNYNNVINSNSKSTLPCTFVEPKPAIIPSTTDEDFVLIGTNNVNNRQHRQTTQKQPPPSQQLVPTTNVPSIDNNKKKSTITTTNLIADGQGRPMKSISNHNHNQNIFTTITNASINLKEQLNFNNKSKSTTTHLPPPPAYFTAINQLRSQNNQSHSYRRTATTTASTTVLSSNNIITNYYGTLDYSLPKSSTSSTCTSNSPSPRYQKQKKQQHYPPSPTEINIKVPLHQSTPIAVTPPRSLPSRIPSPICLITSSAPVLRQAPSPSVLRFAESPVSAQYVERENGEFIVQESPRHVVECFEKDDGEFSVIEKVIGSPPEIVQIEEFSEKDSLFTIPTKIPNNNNDLNNKANSSNSSIRLSASIKTEQPEKKDISSKYKIMHPDPCSSTSSLENNKKMMSSIVNPDKQLIPTSHKKNSPGTVKVLSNVKLEPNESLDIMENINKIGSERFWTEIVQSIKKEEVDTKIWSVSTSSSITVDNKSPPCSSPPPAISEAITTESNCSGSSATTSVIRLASNHPTTNDNNNSTDVPEKSIASSTSASLNKPPAKAIASTSRDLNNKKPYRKHPKKLVVKFKNPPIPPQSSSIITTNESQNEAIEVIDLVESIPDTPHETVNELNTKPINNVEECTEDNLNGLSESESYKIQVILDMNETVFSVTEINENDYKLDIECSEFQQTETVNSLTSTEFLRKEHDVASKAKIIDNVKNDAATTSLGIKEEKDDNLSQEISAACSFIKLNKDIPEIDSSKMLLLNSKIGAEKPNKFTPKIDSTTNSISESLNSIISSSATSQQQARSKPSTSCFEIREIQETDSQQQQQSTSSSHHNTTYDYPFSFLYSGSNNSINNSMPPIVEQHVVSDASCSNSSHAISKNNLSSPVYHQHSTASDIFSTHHYSGPIFHSNSNLQYLDDEKSSYLDLDACSKAVTSCSASSSVGCSNGSRTRSSNTQQTHIQLGEALNIRTDEKMPAKGEISEQESNGDIENSWSQPLYTELPYKFPNPYDHFVSRESWSLSHDDFFVPHDLSTSGRSRFVAEKRHAPGTSTEVTTTAVATKKKKRTKKSTEPSATATNAISALPSQSVNTTISSPNKRKVYNCEHCGIIFMRLKDRSLHLIEEHQYQRVKRRLVRQIPTSTVTSATITLQTSSLTQPKIEPIDSADGSSIRNNIKIEDSNEIIGGTNPLNLNIISEIEDKKPIVGVVATSSAETVTYPKTKFDSIRAGVYRMLMNFNLSVLQQKGGIDVDEKSSFESKSFCCYTCKRDFISVKLFDEHLSEHAAECFTCGKKFSRWTYFSLHLKRHLGWKDFWCTLCDKKFVIRSALIEHVRTHTGAAPLKCNICTKSFKRYSNLTQHKKLCHNNRPIRKKEYVCFCGEVLPSKARFLWHKEIHDAKPKCCPWCRDRFVHANSLRRHIRLTHSDKFSYSEPTECTICNQIYAKSSLKGHMATHSLDTTHECPICNKSFSTKWNLKIHSWVHANRTAKPFKCEHCTKAFVREVDYKNHMNAHKQIRPYTCEYCGCKFIRKYNYMRHRREHHGQKKFSCDLCSKLFHRHYYLIEHRRIHTGERPFLCTICGKSSTTKTNHNKHLKIHHSRDPFTSES